jgi:hypothetical protein
MNSGLFRIDERPKETLVNSPLPLPTGRNEELEDTVGIASLSTEATNGLNTKVEGRLKSMTQEIRILNDRIRAYEAGFESLKTERDLNKIRLGQEQNLRLQLEKRIRYVAFA